RCTGGTALVVSHSGVIRTLRHVLGASGEAKPESSLTNMANPSVESETSNPREMVAKNSGANRYAALATSLEMVTVVMLSRISLSNESSSNRFSMFTTIQ
ncbi:MAG: hypothetical protein ACKOE0_02050, partial [Actinomycetes bacterium]